MKIKYLSLIIIALTLSLSLNLLFGWQALAQIQAQGTLDSPDTPANTFSYTLEDLYNRLTNGTAGSQIAFTEPVSGPTTATMHSLNEIMAAAPALDNTNGATTTQVATGATYWGLQDGAWGPQTGTGVIASGNATDGQVLAGRTYSNDSGASTGAMPNNGAGSTIVPTTTNQTIALGYWSSANTVQGDSNLTAGNIVSGTSIFGVTGSALIASGNATDAQVLAGRTYSNDSGASTGAMPNNGAGSTIVPTTTNQTIALGYWSSANTVQGDSNLTATNIVSGAQIFGVTGTYPLAAVPKTGITICYDDNGNFSVEIPCAGTGQDGEFQMGVTPPTPRFVDNGDGTVTDNLTQLIWLQDQTCPSLSVSAGAYDAMLAAATTLQDGQCGLTDGSSPGDWRHPNIYELISVLGLGYDSGLNFALPAPFTSSNGFFNVLGATRLSSTPYLKDSVYATGSGKIEPRLKTIAQFGWAVRGGQ